MRIALAILLLFPQLAFASEVCYVVDIASWTQTQKNHLAALAVDARQVAGESAPLTQWSNATGQVCFDSPTVDLTSALSPATLLTRFAAWEAADQAANQAEDQRQAAFESEVIGNNFCSGELADVKAAVDAQIDAWVTARQTEINATTNFATLKAALRDQTIPAIGTAMKTGLKKAVGCVRARAR